MALGTLAHYIAGIVVIGAGATALVDLWSLFLKRFLGIPSLSYCLVGRWFLHMPEGRFRHESIAAASRKAGECAFGWVAHYATGIVFAAGLVLLVSGDWMSRPTAWPALLFGLSTVVFPFLVMQPSFGLGIAAAKAPDPMKARLKSLATHLVFGAGLYLSALAWNRVPGIHG